MATMTFSTSIGTKRPTSTTPHGGSASDPNIIRLSKRGVRASRRPHTQRTQSVSRRTSGRMNGILVFFTRSGAPLTKREVQSTINNLQYIIKAVGLEDAPLEVGDEEDDEGDGDEGGVLLPDDEGVKFFCAPLIFMGFIF